MDATTSTRERILAAALVVLARDGYAKASTRAIAAEAGVAQGLANYHFGSRQALIGEAVAGVREQFMALVAAQPLSEGDGPEMLRETLELTRAILDVEPRWYSVITEISALALRDGAAAGEAKAIISAGTAAVREYLDLSRAAFGLPPLPDAEAQLLAAVAIEAFNGLAVRYLLDDQFDHLGAFVLLERMLISVLAPGHEPSGRAWREDPLQADAR